MDEDEITQNLFISEIFSGIVNLFTGLETMKNLISDRNYLGVSPGSQKVKYFMHLILDHNNKKKVYAHVGGGPCVLCLHICKHSHSCWHF